MFDLSKQSQQRNCAYHSIYKPWLNFLHSIPSLQRLKLAKFHSLRIRSLSVIMTKILHLLLASIPFAFAHHTPLKARQISRSLFADDSEVVAASWYPSWLGTKVPPESLSWDKYTSVTFAFAYVFQLTEEHVMTFCIIRLTTSDPSAVSIDSDGLALLPRFVAQAKSHVGLNEHLECGCDPDQYLERQRIDQHWWMDRFPILLVQRGDSGQPYNFCENCDPAGDEVPT